jgi:hypothetical protein
VLEEDIFPLREAWTSPVSVDTFDRGIAILGDLFHHLAHIGAWDVVTIDEDGEFFVGCFHREIVGVFSWIARNLLFSPRCPPYSISFLIESCYIRESKYFPIDEPLYSFTIMIEKEECVFRLKKSIALVVHYPDFLKCDIWKWYEAGDFSLSQKRDECVRPFFPEDDKYSILPGRIGDAIEWCDDEGEWLL